MIAPRLDRDGDALIWVWESIGIAIGFDQLRETSEGLHGEISVQSTEELEGGKKGHFHWAKYNLSSTRARSELAKVLNGRNQTIDWHGMLEVACVKTAEIWRDGEPVVDLSAVEAPDEDVFLVSKLLPEGESTVIFADGGSGKSVFALCVGLAVRMNRALPNGLQPAKASNVLYLDWETNRNEAAKRLNWLARGVGLAAPPTILYRSMYRALADDVSRLRQEVQRHAVGLVIVDSIAPACGGEPENAETMLRVFNALRSLSPATRLIISHVSRAGAEQKAGSARPFGSVFVQNMARSVWELRRSEEGSTDHAINIGLYHRKTNTGRLCSPLGFEIEFDEAQKAIRLRGVDVNDDSGLAAHASLSYRIRQALKSGGRPTTDLAEELDVSESAVRQALRRMPDATQLQSGGGRGKSSVWGLAATDEGRF